MTATKRRITRRTLPLEWVFKRINATTTATNYVDSLDLDLLQDEVAEIWKIDSEILWDIAGTELDALEKAETMLSMNPDLSTAVAPNDEKDDLETFFSHNDHYVGIQVTAVGIQNSKRVDRKISDFVDRPILVGTNVGMKWRYESGAAADLWWELRLYFTRRNATVEELNQILLKRR